MVESSNENLEKKTNKYVKALSYIAFPVTGWVNAIKDGWTSLRVFKPTPGLESKVKKLCSFAVKSVMGAVGVIAGFPLYVLNHELMHSAAAKVAGCGVINISINDYIGGKIFSLMPGVANAQMKGLGLTHIAREGGAYATAAYLYAPQILTIPGIYLFYKGMQKKNAFLTGFGAAFAYGGFEMAFNHKWGSDFGQIVSAFGSDSKAMLYVGSAAAVGATYYLSKKIAEYLVKFDAYVDKKLPILKFKTPLLIGAMTAALLFAGQPNAKENHPQPKKYEMQHYKQK